MNHAFPCMRSQGLVLICMCHEMPYLFYRHFVPGSIFEVHIFVSYKMIPIVLLCPVFLMSTMTQGLSGLLLTDISFLSSILLMAKVLASTELVPQGHPLGFG